MKKLTCAFFGHSSIYDYSPYEDTIRETVKELIDRGVTEFYNGYRGKLGSIACKSKAQIRSRYSGKKKE